MTPLRATRVANRSRIARTICHTPPRDYVAFAASWSVIGTAIFSGGGAGLTAWALRLADHDMLILDEPLGALDPQTARTVLAVARRRARTLVVISQE